MTTSDDGALALLQTLLRICRDSIEGYTAASHDVVEPELTRLFHDYEKQRRKLCAELEQRIRELRGDPNEVPPSPGVLHRTWMNLRAATAENPSETVLAEIERAEDVAVAAYRDAEKVHDIDAITRRLVEHQYEVVQAAHDRIRQLRDRGTYARSQPNP